MYISSVIDFINSLSLQHDCDNYVGKLKGLNYNVTFEFNKSIIDILKNYNNHYICVYFIDFHKYIDIDISHSLYYNIFYKCVLISNEDYILYKLGNI